ncbi:MAG: L-seryl-tRNA(Sec) selenium transferase [Acidobacteria bacterium]|nr:L-seryl-tRNA(Sec) selenium transferase [Acidobacteriota bacterium]
MTDYRVIPSIEQLRQRPGVRALQHRYGHGAVVRALRDETDALRRRLGAGQPDAAGPSTPDEAAALIEAGLEPRLARAVQTTLRPVINATGVIVHTNLGRAPLPAAALQQVTEIGARYSTLEFDLDEGGRGHRDRHAEPMLCRLTGADAAVVVNNNAAATLLALAAVAAGREVIVSRGELVEIGGGFRVPEVMAQSGAILREVGTTNRTRASDYEAAISEKTAMMLRVHRSNFTIEGFTEQPSLAELVEIGRRRGVTVGEDLGSGNLAGALSAGVAVAGVRLDALPWLQPFLRDEPTVPDSIAAGVDLVWVSGDKLLGGPQAGVILGRRPLVETIRRHPLMRALRVDKMTYAALTGTLVEYVTGRAAQTVPVLEMLTRAPGAIEIRAERLAARLAAAGRYACDIVDGRSTIGGGTTPGLTLPTRLLALTHTRLSADSLEAALRRLDLPIVARIENDRVVLDLRTVFEDEDAAIADGLLAVD